MNIDTFRTVLLYCTVINFGVLALWGLLFILLHAWVNGVAGRMFQLPAERFDAINLAGLLFYKVGIVLFNLVPYLALRLIG